MARRTSLDDGSLELLLDTITNAFGGILFLAILVVVLLKGAGNSNAPPAQVAASKIAELTDRLRQLEADLSTVNIEIQASEAITANLADPDLKSTLHALQKQKLLRDQLAHQKLQIEERINQSREQLEDMQERGNNLSQDIQVEMLEVQTLRSNLDQERARRKIKSPFPEERSVSKSDYSVTMRYGRWYVDRWPDGRPNLDDFALLDSEGEYLTVTPKPYRGIPVKDGKEFSKRIASSLRSMNPADTYMCIAIWDDSFTEFQLVRDFLVENGFEYRLIAVAEDDEIVEGFVPNPQVQ